MAGTAPVDNCFFCGMFVRVAPLGIRCAEADAQKKFGRQGSVVKMHAQRPVKLAFYTNGFSCDGEFRPYSVPANRAYVQV